MEGYAGGSEGCAPSEVQGQSPWSGVLGLCPISRKLYAAQVANFYVSSEVLWNLDFTCNNQLEFTKIP